MSLRRRQESRESSLRTTTQQIIKCNHPRNLRTCIISMLGVRTRGCGPTAVLFIRTPNIRRNGNATHTQTRNQRSQTSTRPHIHTSSRHEHTKHTHVRTTHTHRYTCARVHANMACAYKTYTQKHVHTCTRKHSTRALKTHSSDELINSRARMRPRISMCFGF